MTSVSPYSRFKRLVTLAALNLGVIWSYVLYRHTLYPTRFALEWVGLLATVLALSALSVTLFKIYRQRSKWLNELLMWQRLFENADWGVAVGSSDKSTYITVNPALAKMYGYTVEEIKGKPIIDLFAPQVRDKVADYIEQTHRHGHYVYETLHIRKDGTVFPVLADVTAVKDEQGKILYRAGHVRDISVRKMREEQQSFLNRLTEALSESLNYENSLQQIAQMAVPFLGDWCAIEIIGENGSVKRVAVVHSDPSKASVVDRMKASPPAIMRMKGLADKIQAGLTIRVEQVDEEEHCKRVGAAHFQMVKEMGIRSYLVAPLQARGKTLGTLTFGSGARVFTEDDAEFVAEVGRRAGIAVDNVRLFNEAQRAVRAREDTVAIISHDLKNPMSAISIMAQLMQRLINKGLYDNAKLKEDLLGLTNRMERSARQAVELADSVLDLAKIEMGGFQLQKHKEGLRGLFKGLSDVFVPLAAEKGVELTCEVHPPHLDLYCDRARIVQAVSNLIANSLKFTPVGGRILVQASSAGTGWVYVSVTDSGEGIPEEFLPTLFERYSTMRQKRPGTGLGLSIVKGIIEAHGGHVRVSSRLGQGSCFTLVFPVPEEARMMSSI
jgi:PAS domain S-box-containing protein